MSPSLFRLTRKRLLVMIIGLAIASPLVYYLASPLFISSTVNEPTPTANSVIVASGTFNGADSFHRASGTARLLQLPDGLRILRLENFGATNGPDLFVYLSADRSASDYVNLGQLKANNGDQNYDIPAETNLGRHRFVLIWCRAFSVLFGSAERSACSSGQQSSLNSLTLMVEFAIPG